MLISYQFYFSPYIFNNVTRFTPFTRYVTWFVRYFQVEYRHYSINGSWVFLHIIRPVAINNFLNLVNATFHQKMLYKAIVFLRRNKRKHYIIYALCIYVYILFIINFNLCITVDEPINPAFMCSKILLYTKLSVNIELNV